MEKIGFGPKEVFNNINPRIIYARLTGYGQPKDSPSWQYAGHDINYLAATGVLDILPHRLPPISILGSFAGGGLLCAFGILLALRRRDITNRGEVIDCNMVQGVTYLSSFIFAMMSKDTPFLNDRKGCGGILRYESHFYNVYETLDGRHLAVGAIERKFYQRFLKGMGVEDDEDFIVGHVDSSRWPRLIERSKNIIKQKRLDEWMGIFDLRESCVSPILTIAEAKNNSNLFVNGQALPKPAPQLDGVVGTTKGGEISSRTAKILDYLNNDEVVKEATKAGVVIMPKVKNSGGSSSFHREKSVTRDLPTSPPLPSLLLRGPRSSRTAIEMQKLKSQNENLRKTLRNTLRWIKNSRFPVKNLSPSLPAEPPGQPSVDSEISDSECGECEKLKENNFVLVEINRKILAEYRAVKAERDVLLSKSHNFKASRGFGYLTSKDDDIELMTLVDALPVEERTTVGEEAKAREKREWFMGVGIMIASVLFLVIGLYAVCFSEMMPYTGIGVLDWLKEDWYYSCLVPALVPLYFIFMLWQWTSTQYFRYA
ncbi:hypothetical protein FOZ60_014366 [Perkinsus olseni]|uniref:Alpha-methylacyl-CoA racemase n=2 Tax=Perkinsus olseni TaxID=32597 RepID=A0A7J6N832_PEROL|nr:hypothetical protein FOZ60_014366 [Perkinsus olseni]